MSYQTILTAAAPTLDTFLGAGFPTSRNRMPVSGVPLIIRALESSASTPEGATVVLNEEEERTEHNSGAIIANHFAVKRIALSPSSAQGALASALMGLESVDRDRPLLIAPGDAVLYAGFPDLLRRSSRTADAITVAFRSSNPRWSYLRLNEDDQIVEVAEKRVIGNLATTGHFFFRRASDFIDASTWVMLNNARFQGRFFVSTALNFLISEGMNLAFEEIDRTAYASFSKPYDFVSQEA